eukprot:TRINITY_DN1396_c0_g1_i1.p1 TRINITY_DN1396_c0_g1~~TRINITY_DN1396_c0_g1_i1.p1  ORF type:complete len:369 (+),score=72.22 TRINITY_DN1396_c0_g1_i1:63-1109(+)
MLTMAAVAATVFAVDFKHTIVVRSADVCAELDGRFPLCTSGTFNGVGLCTKGPKGTQHFFKCYPPACGPEPTDPATPMCEVRNVGIEMTDENDKPITKPIDEESTINAEGVMGASIGTTTTTSSFLAAGLFSGMEGWPDIPKARFLNFPNSLHGRLGQVPNVYVGKGWRMTFHCAIGGEGGMCDLFVFIYRCPPCTFSDGGNLPLALLADNWEPYSCDVKFQLDNTVPTHEHSMMVYHKQIPQAQRRSRVFEVVSPTDLLELTFFGISEATSHCVDYTTETDCTTVLPGECQWDSVNEVCGRTICPKQTPPPRPLKPGHGFFKPQGPWVDKCKVCVDDERQYMPTLTV